MPETTRTRRGRPPKGDRAQVLARMPRAHREAYEKRAQAEGLPLGTYVALVLAEAHGLEPPPYVERDRVFDAGQEELPLGA